MEASSIDGGDRATFIQAEEKFFELTNQLESQQNRKMDLSYNENFIDTGGRELLRRLLQAHLDTRGVGDVGKSIKGADGIDRTHKRIRIRNIKSIFGKIHIKRIGYSARGNYSLFPEDAQLNLPKNSYSYGLQKRIAVEMIKNSFEEVVQSINQTTGLEISTSQIEKIISEIAQDFDAFYEQECESKRQHTKTLPILALTCDGKGVVMRREDLREATRKKAEKNIHKLEKRLSRGEKKNAKRMATVASVYNIERFPRTPEEIIGELASLRTEKMKQRPKPMIKRVWASLEKSSKDVIQTMFSEAVKRDPDIKKIWVGLVDGDLKQIKQLKTIAKKYKVKLIIVCDIIHVLEYLWKASRVFNVESSPDAQKWVADRFLKILKGKASSVAAGMRRSATNQGIDETVRKPVDICATYFLNHTDYMHYDNYLKEGFPIATGVIEGACRYLVNDRMDVTGARWSLKGAEAVLKMRSIKSSGDFEKYWVFHEKQGYERNHISKYANPSILKPH